MEHNIFVHDDYCSEMCSEDVQKILSEITTLVTDAILRSTTESGDGETAT